LDDAALVARLATGEEAAFDEAVRRHGPLVLGICRRGLGHVQDAEDAFQATFLTLSRKAGSIRRGSSLAAWLHGTAVRVCRKAARRRGVQPVRMAQDATDPFADVAWKEVRGVLDEELSQLAEAYRGPLVHCYLEGRSRDEAAALLGVSRRTLLRRLEVGRDRLRTRLARRGVATVTLGIAVLDSCGLAAPVPAGLAAATLRASHTPPAAVSALVGVPVGLRTLFVGVGLVVLAVGGAGWTWQKYTRNNPPTTRAEPAKQTKEPADGSAGTDADGRSLPPSAVARLGSRKFRTEGHNAFILPSPDAKYVLVQPQPSLSAYPAQGLFLLDAETGLRVREFENGRRVPKLTGDEPVRPVAFSPDGLTLFGIVTGKGNRDDDPWAQFHMSADRRLAVWDVATGKKTAEWDLPPGYEGPRSGNNTPGASPLGLSVTPDGKRLIVSGAVRMIVKPDRRIDGVAGFHTLDATTGTRLKTWETSGLVVGILTNGNEVLTIRQDAEVTAYEVATGRASRTYPIDGPVGGAVVSPDGRTIAALGRFGADKDHCEIRMWEAATAKVLHRLPVARKSEGRLAFSADGGMLLLGTESGRIQRWAIKDGAERAGWDAHAGPIADLFIRPGRNELVSAGSWDGHVRRWDAATGNLLSASTAYTGEVSTVCTPDRTGVVTVDESGRLNVWDLATARVTRTWQTPGKKHHIPVFTPDGKHLLLAAQTGPNTIWSWPDGKQTGTFEPPPVKGPNADEYWWGTLRFSPDGKRLFASKFGRGGWVWTWPDRKVLWHEAMVPESTFLPDKKTIVTTEWHAPIQYRDLETGKVLRTVEKVDGGRVGDGTLDVAVTRDSRRMITGHFDKTFKVRDAATGAILKSVPSSGFVWSLAFSPSGWLLAVAADNAVRVYDTATWIEVARFDGHDGTVKTVFFGPDDYTLVSSSPEDGTSLVWSLRPDANLPPPEPAKLWADFIGDGPAVRRAVTAAAAHPDVAIKLFREKWPIPKPVDADQVRKLIDGLDAPVFVDREAASAALAKLGRSAEDAVKRAATDSPSAEVRKRASALLTAWAPSTLAEDRSEDARERRAVWALELARTPATKELLTSWAEAKTGNRLGEEAAAALRRLSQGN
jgi:RNA polymerase sigma factor (sigma-70 family)